MGVGIKHLREPPTPSWANKRRRSCGTDLRLARHGGSGLPRLHGKQPDRVTFRGSEEPCPALTGLDRFVCQFDGNLNVYDFDGQDENTCEKIKEILEANIGESLSSIGEIELQVP
jgi:hypothetical protein